MKNEPSKFTCCICKNTVKEYGNNPFPLAGKKCCSRCDYNYVMPIRSYMGKLEEAYENKDCETPYDRIKRLMAESENS